MRKTIYKTNQNNPQIKEYKLAIEKGKQSYHVLHSNDGWIVKRAGSEKGVEVFSTQKEGREFAEDIAKNSGASLFIHGKDGTIQDRLDFSI